MQLEVLTLRFDPTRGVLDDTALKAFSRDKIILNVRDHFFLSGSVPHLVLVIEYRLPAPSAGDGSDGKRRPHSSVPKTDTLRQSLAPDEREIFDLLRSWRSGVAHDDAVPAYAVLTNAQLVELSRLRPTTKSELLRVPGLGKKKAERYAAALLPILARAQPPAAAIEVLDTTESEA